MYLARHLHKNVGTSSFETDSYLSGCLQTSSFVNQDVLKHSVNLVQLDHTQNVGTSSFEAGSYVPECSLTVNWVDYLADADDGVSHQEYLWADSGPGQLHEWWQQDARSG